MSDEPQDSRDMLLEIQQMLERLDLDFTRPNHYRLEGHTPVPCTMMEWAAQFRDIKARRVRLTIIGPFRISTVFLGLDHNFTGHGPPVLFETMTFIDGPKLEDFEGHNKMDGRSSTWEEAEERHFRSIRWILENYAAPGETPRDVTD